jgi:sialate O-acetylesterase
MKPLLGTVAWGVATVVSTVAIAANADVRVAPWIGSHMVVQQGRPVRLSGTDAPGIPIRAALGAGSATTRADSAGHWFLTVPAVPAGGPYVLRIEGSNRIAFSDVWSGEVWIASGQSNMELSLSHSRGGKEASADGCPGMRLFTVAHKTAVAPVDTVEGTWETCESATADAFSAVAFYFGRELHRALGVPIGIVETTWGGTPAEAWTPREALLAEPAL